MFSILFKRFRNDTTKQGTIAFVHIGKPVTRDDAIRWIHEKGFRPATMDDAEPERDKMIRSASKFPIVFLGTVHIKKGVPCSPCLHKTGLRSEIDLMRIADSRSCRALKQMLPPRWTILAEFRCSCSFALAPCL